MTERRIIVCETCAGDGGFVDVVGHGPEGPIEDWFECRSCGGWGHYEVAVEPIEMEDLDAIR